MKKILTYMTLMAAVLLTACSDGENFAQKSESSNLGYIGNRNTISMPLVVHEENWDGNSGLESKSSLSYKYNTGRLLFEWFVGDKVGVYPLNYVDEGEKKRHDPKDSQCTAWEIYSVTTTTEKSVGVFDENDESISTHKDESYIAVSPFILDDTDYRDIPVTYVGQVQSASAKIGAYMKRATPDEEESYVASEVEACSHLSTYDYLVDTERQATEDGGKMRFEMKRLSSIVRFYMKVPERIVFDSLQLYNPTKNFTLTTTLDGSTGEYAEEPTRKSHATSLKLNEFGFDYTICTADDDYYYNPTIRWVMLCYMMVAPIDLSEAETEQSSLYLIGRDPLCYTNVVDYNAAWGTSISAETFATYTPAQKIKLYDNVSDYNTDNHKSLTEGEFNALPKSDKMMVYPDVAAFNAAKGKSLSSEDFAKLTIGQKITRYTRKVYKATLAKKNLQADVLYQWSTANAAEDDPIEFQNITIQEWAEGPGFTNADGDGTADW